MGMLAAVRQWYQRDHAAEQRTWQTWLETIVNRVKGLPSVTAEFLQPDDLSNKSPRLRLHWDANQLKITGTELVRKLDDGTPRIMVDGGTGHRPDDMASTLTVMPYMMTAGEEHIVADAIYNALTNPGPYANPVIPTGPPAPVAGTWAVTITYTRGTATQHIDLTQSGNDLTGTLHGEIYTSALTGSVHANEIKLHSEMAVSGTSITWNFTGTVTGSTITGKVNLGEYGEATWQAMKA